MTTPFTGMRLAALTAAAAFSVLCVTVAGSSDAYGNPDARKPVRPTAWAGSIDLSSAGPETLVFQGLVLIGVDTHGRVLIALDESHDGRRDGLGDRYYLFDTLEQLDGPWFRMLRQATLAENDGGIAVMTDDRSFAVSLTMETGAAPLPPGQYRELRQFVGGVELSVATPKRGYRGTPISSLSYRDIETWPQAFRPRDQGAATNSITP